MRAPRIGYIACVLIVGASAATAQEESDAGIDFPPGYVVIVLQRPTVTAL
jgi:hypothetical protein